MATKKAQPPTAEEVIRQHLGGRIITREMRAEMLRMQIHPAWLTSWNRKERKIVFGCCGKTITDKGRLSEKGRQAMREARHREKGRCPYCGKWVRWLDCNKVRYDDVEEHWHVFYRRSQKDENTLIVLGVWCGIKTHHMKEKDREAREEWAKRIQPEFEPCEMMLLPWAGVPRRWNRKPLNKWSSWHGRYVPTWNGHSTWESVRTVAMHSQGMARWGAWNCTDHESGLPTGQEGGRWGKMLDWCMEDWRARWLGQGGVLTLCAISRHPQLEYMTKGGLEPLAVATLQGTGTGVIHERARNPAKMLPMLDSNELARLKRLPPQAVTVNGLRLVEMVKQAGQRVKMEDALRLVKANGAVMNDYSIDNVLKDWGQQFGVMRLVRYFAKQDLGYGAAQMWADYMRELATLQEMEESRFFPKNLWEEHAKTSKRVKLLAAEQCAEAVKARAEELKKRFTFEACGIRMEPFGTPDEIIREGAWLDICIGDYVESYAQGNTILLKMRKKSDPDTPWHAVEFEKTGRRVVQCRGYANATWPEDVPLVEAFWKAWSKEKKQEQKPHLIINKRARRNAQ